MNRTDILNLIARRIRARTYLEIGVREPTANFNWIDVKGKTWVDPKGPENDDRGYRVMSADFFQGLDREPEAVSYDLIFIDGDHRYQGVKYDIHHAMKYLSPGGVLVLHDVLPLSPKEGAADKPSGYKGAWCGEVWRAWSELRAWGYSNGHVTYVVDCDHGVGVVYGDADHDIDGMIGEIDDSGEYQAPWIDRSSYGVVIPAHAEREINAIPRPQWLKPVPRVETEHADADNDQWPTGDQYE